MISSPRQHALEIFRAALAAADPERAILRHLRCDGGALTAGGRRYPLARFERVFVLGAGKAGAPMARAVQRLLGPRVTGGLIAVPDGSHVPMRRMELCPCGHPLPDRRGQRAASRILDLARQAGPRDLVICLISGGASALLPCPAGGLALDDKQRITSELLASGATIHELNTVRKHLSGIKGGRLAAAAYPATVLALILSDVVGDDLDVIGSGPTVPDRSTLDDARRVLRKYGVRVRTGVLRETPKPGDREFRKVRNLIAGNNRQAVDAAARAARRLRYHTLVLSTSIQGEAREVAAVHAAVATEVLASGQPLRRPACILSGGETTVSVRGAGRGGRNQEFVLAALIALGGAAPVTIFSAGTDGIDGPTDAAGAIADSATFQRARRRGLNARAYLDNNDSYRFFQRVNGLVKTGPTGTNVMDVRILLVP